MCQKVMDCRWVVLLVAVVVGKLFVIVAFVDIFVVCIVVVAAAVDTEIVDWLVDLFPFSTSFVTCCGLDRLHIWL